VRDAEGQNTHEAIGSVLPRERRVLLNRALRQMLRHGVSERYLMRRLVLEIVNTSKGL
jgi:hypothetical protein